MKKLLAFFAIFGLLTFGTTSLFAQEEAEAPVSEEVAPAEEAPAEEAPAVEEPKAEAAPAATAEAAPAPEGKPMHQQLKTKFIEGGAGFMAIVILALIIGLAVAIERIIYLNLASTNTEKLLKRIEDALNEGGIEGALEVCRNTRGPVASIFYQGLTRADEGLEMVEKSVISYGGVQMGLMEKGLPWISLCISLAPMLGFMGTVIGMIDAFDAIEIAGDISPTLVASGIKKALITTVAGLVVAIILQIFYNYLLSKTDSIVNRMEDASISLVDILAKYSK